MILYFLKKYFDDKDDLIIPIKPWLLKTPASELQSLFQGKDFKEDYKTLNREIRALGYNIPPLVNAYMNLSPTMKLFGTAINYGFGDVEETGILIAVDEIFEEKEFVILRVLLTNILKLSRSQAVQITLFTKKNRSFMPFLGCLI